jgi:RecJ-like exonuclease
MGDRKMTDEQIEDIAEALADAIFEARPVVIKRKLQTERTKGRVFIRRKECKQK